MASIRPTELRGFSPEDRLMALLGVEDIMAALELGLKSGHFYSKVGVGVSVWAE